jgi:hypothetical protein
LSSHMPLGLPSGLFSSNVSTEILNTFLISFRSPSSPFYLIVLNLIP